jgi:hypothetical protein
MKLRDTPVVEALGRRLRMVMGRVDAGVPPQTPAAELPPQVEFIGYAEDCVLTGQIRMDTARLTDLLNAHDEFELVDVGVESKPIREGGPSRSCSTRVGTHPWLCSGASGSAALLLQDRRSDQSGTPERRPADSRSTAEE